MSTDDVKGISYYIAGATVGCIVLTLFVLFCITAILLCKILRRLRELSRVIQPQESETSSKKQTAAEHGSKQDLDQLTSDVPPHVETIFTNTEAQEPKPPEEIEAMYSVVSEEHRQKKKMAKLCIQQYDDVNLLPVDSKEGERGEGSQLLASVTIEGEGTGYSRLHHAGPRMSQTRKHMFTSSGAAEQQKDSGKRSSVSALVTKDLSYSEVRPTDPSTEQPVPIKITGGYSVIEQTKNDDEVPPPLPRRVSICIQPQVDTTPTIEKPEAGSDAPGAKEGGNNYSVVGKGEPRVTDNPFFDEQFLSEFCAQEKGSFGEKLYDSVK